MGQGPGTPPFHGALGQAPLHREEGPGRRLGQAWGVGRGGTRTDLQLPLDPVLAAVPVLGLGRVIFGHYFHELPGECRMLGWGHTHEEAGSRDQGEPLVHTWSGEEG